MKISRWWSLLLIPLLAWGGFSSLTYDYSAKITAAILYQPNSKPDEKAISAALSAKFPPGTPEAEFTSFITGLGGTCFEGPEVITAYCGADADPRSPQCATQVNDTLRCSIKVSGTLCIVNRLSFQTHLSSTKGISAIIAKRSNEKC